MCKCCRAIACDEGGDEQELSLLCKQVAHKINYFPCMCIPYAREYVVLLASKKCTQRHAAIVLASWPEIGKECVFEVMASGNDVALQWLLAQQPPPDFAWYVRFCSRQSLPHRIRYTTPVMLLLVQHGWCPWASGNPGTTLEVLQTAAWAARKRYAGVHPDVMAFLPMCTMPGCDANHGVFDQRVLQCQDDDMDDWRSEDMILD